MASEIEELRELAALARRDGDDKLELSALERIDQLSAPSFRAPDGNFFPTPMDEVGLMDGEPRNANFFDKAFRSELETPWTPLDVLTESLATAGSVVAPQVTIPRFLNKLRVAAPFIRNAPKIAAAGAGGGFGRGIQQSAGENTLDQMQSKNTLLDILAAGGEGAKEFAGAEALGFGLSGMLGSGVRAMIGPEMTAESADALQFARKQGAKIPLSSVKEGAGAAIDKASDLTIFGNMLRENSANKINKFIEQHAKVLTPRAKTPEIVAPRAQTLLKETLEGAADAKNVAFQELESVVGKDSFVPDQAIKRAVAEALEEARSQGKRITGPLKELEQFALFEGDRTFGSIERFRKDTLNKIVGNYQTKEIGEPVQNALLKTYQDLGSARGIDINKSILQANQLMKDLTALNKIPGIKKFSADVRSPEGWITGFVNENNQQALNIIQKQAPDLYESLVQQRLSLSFFDRSKNWSPKGFVKFVSDNPKFIKETYGEDTAKVLKNFSSYIQSTEDFASSGRGLKGAIRGGAMSGGLGAIFRSPELAATSELAGSSIAIMLTNPNSALFKVFSETDPVKVSRALDQLVPFITRTEETINGQ